jgi:hypothetical protein
MITPNLSDMNEVVCQNCGKPLVMTPHENDPAKATFDGCNCGREIYDLPADFVVAGFSGGPLFLYSPKPK